MHVACVRLLNNCCDLFFGQFGCWHMVGSVFWVPLQIERGRG